MFFIKFQELLSIFRLQSFYECEILTNAFSASIYL